MSEELRIDAVSVVFTTVNDTIEAAKVAAGLATAMRVALRVVHFRTVPRQLPVDQPDGLSPIETQSFIARLRREGIRARIRFVVIGGRRSWWPTRAERWRRALEAAGHFVLFVDPSEHKELSHA